MWCVDSDLICQLLFQPRRMREVLKSTKTKVQMVHFKVQALVVYHQSLSQSDGRHCSVGWGGLGWG